jgi:hypothetical protein
VYKTIYPVVKLEDTGSLTSVGRRGLKMAKNPKFRNNHMNIKRNFGFTIVENSD